MASTSKEAVGETINLGSGKDIKVCDLVFLIAKVLEKQAKIVKDPKRFRPYDVDCLFCDYTKAEKILGWKPQVSLEDGLKRTVEWIASNPVKFKGSFKGWPRSYYRQAHVDQLYVSLGKVNSLKELSKD